MPIVQRELRDPIVTTVKKKVGELIKLKVNEIFYTW